MDESVARLMTAAECEQFIENVQAKHPDLARQARVRAVELKAASHGAKSDVEREALEAVHAYEDVRSLQSGRRFRASRTWQMIERHGILPAVERAVNRTDVTEGYNALVRAGMERFAFESVILRHPGHFSAEAVRRSQERLGR